MTKPSEQIGVQNNAFIKTILRKPKQIRRNAKKLHDAKWIYGLYGALDGLSTSFSMLKYFFDVYYTNSSSSSSDMLHDWIITPWGIVFVVAESAAMIGCAVVGNTLGEDEYDLYFTSIDETVNAKSFNCYIWDGAELAYISPTGEVTRVNRASDTGFKQQMELLKFKAKFKAKAKQQASVLRLSADDVSTYITAYGGPAPTATVNGSIAYFWPYSRDVMKALKNTFKGLRNAFVFADLLTIGRHFNLVMLPAGLAMGVVASYNRTWLRKVRDERKDAKKENAALVEYIRDKLCDPVDMSELTLQDWDIHQREIEADYVSITQLLNGQAKSEYFWLYAYVSAAISGVVDAPYLYFGALTLTALSVTSGLFIFVAASSIFFALACVIARVYEEHNYQRELLITQNEVKLARALLEFKVLSAKANAISNEMEGALSDQRRSELLISYLSLSERLKNMADILSWGDALHEQSTLSTFSVMLGGIKNGLDAYGALASLMFVLATISVVLAIPYSPLVVVAFVGSGLACIVFFTALALINPSMNLYEKLKVVSYDAKKKQPLLSFFVELKQCIEHEIKIVKKVESTTDLADVVQEPEVLALPPVVDPSPQYFFQEWFEVIRLFCSGAGKAFRAADIVMVSAQEKGDDGHYHDTDSVVIFAWINAVFFAAIFALRGIARLGREKIDEDDFQAETVVEQDVIDTQPASLAASSEVDLPHLQSYEASEGELANLCIADSHCSSPSVFLTQSPRPSSYLAQLRSSSPLNESFRRHSVFATGLRHVISSPELRFKEVTAQRSLQN